MIGAAKVAGKSITRETASWQEDIRREIGRSVIRGLKIFPEGLLEEFNRSVPGRRQPCFCFLAVILAGGFVSVGIRFRAGGRPALFLFQFTA